MEMPADLPHNFGILGVEVGPAKEDTLRVARILPGSPAREAGLRAGDIILSAGPYRIRNHTAFSRYIKSLKPTTDVDLGILRDGEALVLKCRVTDIRHLYFLMGEQGISPAADGPRHQRWDRHTGDLESALLDLVQCRGASGVLDSLRAAFAMEAARYSGDCRLGDVHYALHHPLKSADLAEDLVLEFMGASDLEQAVAVAARHLDLDADPSGAVPSVTILDSVEMDGELRALLLDPCLRAAAWTQHAFSTLDSDERGLLLSRVPSLVGRFGRGLRLDRDDSTGTGVHAQTLRLAKRVDLGSLSLAGGELARLARPEHLRRLRRAASRSRTPLPPLPDTFGGRFLFAAQSAWGWILIGDKGPNTYGSDAAIIVDLGGDDVYLNNCGSPIVLYSSGGGGDGTAPEVRRRSPVGLLIDYGGDDRYISNRFGTGGAAVGGVGLLLDLEGDDVYQGAHLTQGSAFCGIGMLKDARGNDEYYAQQAAQGSAFFGAGLLLDDRGSDLYSATLFGQGFGGSRGLGLLRDQRGTDRYLADRQSPSSYGTEDVYKGWSQGSACGFRGHASGGIGLLVDGEGDDEYQAGNFSQGVGYFFGLGILSDRSGDDVYRGTRYTQGASAHQAIGVLADGAGDDQYLGRIAANQGGAWDVGVAVLKDDGGNDRYEAHDLAQGAAAMNGFGILFDRGGADRYTSGTGQGYGGSTTYWGGRDGRNLGILIDLGGALDLYSLDGRGDGEESQGTNVGLFLDR